MVPAHSSTSVQVLTILTIHRLVVDLPRADVKPAGLLFLGPLRSSLVFSDGKIGFPPAAPRTPQKVLILSPPLSFSPLGCHPSVSSFNLAKHSLAPSLSLLSCTSLLPVWHDGGQLRFFPFCGKRDVKEVLPITCDDFSLFSVFLFVIYLKKPFPCLEHFSQPSVCVHTNLLDATATLFFLYVSTL